MRSMMQSPSALRATSAFRPEQIRNLTQVLRSGIYWRSKVRRERRGPQGPQGHRDLKVRQEPQVRRGHKEFRAPLVPRVLPALLVHRVYKGLPVRWGRLVQQG